jgi:hypothetical protein
MHMNRIHFGILVCATGVLAASVGFAQDQQPPPFTPATGVGVTTTTATPTADTSGSVVVRVDGSRVIDLAGQPVGRIENIVMSPVGCAEAAILASANGRLIPIPWTLVRVSGDTRAAGFTPGGNLVFTLNVDQARLAQAPSFTRSQWPDMSNAGWLQASTTFFGTAAGVGATGGATNTVTGGATNRIGTTATGGPDQSRLGTTPTRVPTNSTSVLPPTGRPTPGGPDFNQPNTPPQTPDIPPGPLPPTRPPQNRPPTPPGGVPPPTPPPGSVPPPNPPAQP